jgi:hypothetical protein
MRRVGVWLVVAGFGLGATGCATAPPRPSVYAYPQRGQTAEQVSRDDADCQAWAKQQTGFDPAAETAKGAAVGGLLGALGGAGVGGGVGYTKNREGYNRAYAACMAARGYEVR